MAGVAEEEAADELDAYQRVRFHAAREAGLTRLEARRFALGETSLQTLWKLRAAGCPPATLARIVT